MHFIFMFLTNIYIFLASDLPRASHWNLKSLRLPDNIGYDIMVLEMLRVHVNQDSDKLLEVSLRPHISNSCTNTYIDIPCTNYLV